MALLRLNGSSLQLLKSIAFKEIASGESVVLRAAFSRQVLMRPNLACAAVMVRPFSKSTRLCYDEFTKRKSEFRIPGMNDERVRERHALVIPLGYLFFFLCLMFVMFLHCVEF